VQGALRGHLCDSTAFTCSSSLTSHIEIYTASRGFPATTRLLFLLPRVTVLSVVYVRQFRLSVRPSVTRVYCIKAAEHITEILSLSDRPIILVFRHQIVLLRKSDRRLHPERGRRIQRESDCRPICAAIGPVCRKR